MRSHKRQQRVTEPRIVERGDGWYVVFHPSTGDYDAEITRDQVGYIGSRRSSDAARELVYATLVRDAA